MKFKRFLYFITLSWFDLSLFTYQAITLNVSYLAFAHFERFMFLTLK